MFECNHIIQNVLDQAFPVIDQTAYMEA